MKLHTFILECTKRLHDSGVDENELEARLLTGFVTGMSQSELILHANEQLSAKQEKHCRNLLDQRCQRIPLSYLFGVREFWSLDFTVTPSVLIPRPETEFLLTCVLQKMASSSCSPATVLDMCTGSGVIAVVLQKELPCTKVVAVDISEDALAVAKKNVEKHTDSGTVALVSADLFSAFLDRPTFELIVCNPPYIEESAISHLAEEVRSHEPKVALNGGVDGLYSITRIVQQAKHHLCSNGWLFIEIGADQGAAVDRLLTDEGYLDVNVVQDWAGRDRVAFGQLARIPHDELLK